MAEFVEDDAAKMSAMKSTLSRAAGSPPFSQALTPIHARRRKKVR
jgi:hypothetical protein